MIRRNNSDRYDVVGAGNDGFSCHRHQWIEVTSGERVAQIAHVVGEKRVYQRKVGTDGHLEQVALAIDIDALLAGLDGCSDAGLREDAAEAIPAGANALDQGSLRYKLYLEFARHHLPLSFRIEADVTDNGLAHQL